MITIVILLVSDPAIHLVLEIVNIVVLTPAKQDVLSHVQVAVKLIVAEVQVVPVHLHLHLHPTIILNNHFQVVPIALEDAKIVVPLGVVPLATRNAKTDAKQLVKEHVVVGVQVHAKLDVKTLAK